MNANGNQECASMWQANRSKATIDSDNEGIRTLCHKLCLISLFNIWFGDGRYSILFFGIE
jgi:hypothetical protein